MVIRASLASNCSGRGVWAFELCGRREAGGGDHASSYVGIDHDHQCGLGVGDGGDVSVGG